jgi:hypothetical protein
VRVAPVVVAVLVAIPFVAALVAVVGTHWHPVGDQAVEVLRMRDVGIDHPPLIGPWSRWGWAHPGPSLFWWLAPWLRVFGADGVLVGTVVTNALAAVGVVVVARRVHAVAAVLAGAATAVLVAGLDPDRLVDPWNPWIVALPFLAVLVAVWAVVAGRTGWLWVAVAVGSFVVQSHVSYALVVGGTVAVAVGAVAWSCWSARRGPDPPSRAAGRHLLAALLVGLVLWLPPLVQQVTDGPGNLGRVVEFASESRAPAAGWSEAVGVFGAQLRPHASWITGDEQRRDGLARSGSAIVAIITLAVTVALGAWATRRGARSAGALAGVAVLAVGLGLVSTMQVTGLMVPYVVGFWRPIAALVYLSIAWSAVAGLRSRSALRVGVVLGTATTAAAVVVLLGGSAPVEPFPTFSRAIAALAPATAAALSPDASYVVRASDPVTYTAVSRGLLLELERRGAHVFNDHERLATITFGADRVRAARDVGHAVLVVAGPVLDAGWRPSAGARRVAHWDPLSPPERVRARQLSRRVHLDTATPPAVVMPLDATLFRDRAVQHGARRRDVDALAALEARGVAYSVYVVPVR